MAGKQFSSSSYSTNSTAQHANKVYEANEDDYDFDQFGNVVEGEYYYAADEDYEDYYEEEGYEEEPVALVSDVPDFAFWDDSALIKCWEAALVEFKVSS